MKEQTVTKIGLVIGLVLIAFYNVGCGSAEYSFKPIPQCTTTEVPSGVQISCPDGSVTTLNNGINGTDGVDGIDGQDGVDGTNGVNGILEVIRPCGHTGTQTEVLLRLSDNTILAHYAGGGNNQFFSILQPGNYLTTGLQGNCMFNVGPAPEYLVTF